MSSSSTVTYTSIYTDFEPGKVFWGADEELFDGVSILEEKASEEEEVEEEEEEEHLALANLNCCKTLDTMSPHLVLRRQSV
ncbi:hypothetical protein Tco_1360204 [Tanacetum coccineum]